MSGGIKLLHENQKQKEMLVQNKDLLPNKRVFFLDTLVLLFFIGIKQAVLLIIIFQISI